MDDQSFYESLPKIDLVFAGSPCQGFSKGGKMKGLEDPRSALFYSFTFIFNQIKNLQDNPHIPFFFENGAPFEIKMTLTFMETIIITKELVEDGF